MIIKYNLTDLRNKKTGFFFFFLVFRQRKINELDFHIQEVKVAKTAIL